MNIDYDKLSGGGGGGAVVGMEKSLIGNSTYPFFLSLSKYMEYGILKSQPDINYWVQSRVNP